MAVAGWLLATCLEARGQLDEGMAAGPLGSTSAFHLQVVSADGSPLDEGGILVPSRPPMTTSYPELWIVPEDLVGLHESSVGIQPLPDPEYLSVPGAKADLHDLSAWSDEVEITDAMLDNDEVDALVDAAHANANTKLGGVLREVWQLLPDGAGVPSWQRTAFVYASSSGAAVTETWLLSALYVYPSSDNGIAMEVRYARHDATPDAGAFTAEVRAEWKPVRLISVDIQDLGPTLGGENEKYLMLASNSLDPEGCGVAPSGAPGYANSALWCATIALGAAIGRGRRASNGQRA